MSRGNNWVGLDKNLIQEFKHIRRKFSMIEAMFSYSVDRDCGLQGSISGYSVLWGWSRNKVRRFLNGIKIESGHYRDGKRTKSGQAIHYIDNTLMSKKDRVGTLLGQGRDTTIKPKPKPKKKVPKKKFIPPTQKEVTEYFLENKFSQELSIKAFKYYDVGNWKDGNGKQVLNWKQKMLLVWFIDENKPKQNKHTGFKEKNYGKSTPKEDISWMPDE